MDENETIVCDLCCTEIPIEESAYMEGYSKDHVWDVYHMCPDCYNAVKTIISERMRKAWSK